MSMDNLEIERKFLVDIDKIPYDLSLMERKEIEQGYILHNPAVRIRSISNSKYYMTFKSNTDNDLVRNEVELEISKEAYSKLMSRDDVCKIKKNRYITFENNNKFELDVFEGRLKGLACLEVEFNSLEEAKSFNAPHWVKKEVTDDKRYTNSELSKLKNGLDELK